MDRNPNRRNAMSDPITNERAETLAADGWKEYPNFLHDYARCFYKRFDTPTQCHFNDDKEGLQVGIHLSKEGYAGFPPNIELEIVGELTDGSWIKLSNYEMRDSLDEVLPAIPRLLAAWETINQDKP